MNINRSLVKSQAQQIIKGKVFQLFIITIIVTFLTGGATLTYNFTNGLNDGYNITSRDDDSQSGDFFNFDDSDDYDSDDLENYFGGDSQDNPLENFDPDSGNITALSTVTPQKASAVTSALAGSLGGVASIVSLVFAPLSVTLAGIYLSLVKRNSNEEFQLGTEIAGLFKNTFNETYFKKLCVEVIVDILTGLLAVLLVFPGVIFHYSAYFSRQIMYEHPNLKPSEAIKLSKKMIKGNRTELFVLDLSFLPWWLLMLITLGIAGIYVKPYYNTTVALYYENFRLRALAEGRIVEDDFLSEAERVAKYNNAQANQGFDGAYYTASNDNAADASANYYNANQAQQYTAAPAINPDGTFFTPDFSQPQPFDATAQNNPTQPYYQPPQQAQPQQPQYYNSVPNEVTNENQPPQEYNATATVNEPEQPSVQPQPEQTESPENSGDDTANSAE